jgi:MFS family permease
MAMAQTMTNPAERNTCGGRCAAEGRAALVTFVTAGDPDHATAQAILHALPGAGAAGPLLVSGRTSDRFGRRRMLLIGVGLVLCGLVIACIGYRTSAIEGVPYAPELGRFPCDDMGRIFPGLYASGWARRGPSGTIGTNRPDGFAVIDAIAADIVRGKGDGAGLDALLARRGVGATDFGQWQRLDAAEIAGARPGAPREKLVRVADMLAVLGA